MQNLTPENSRYTLEVIPQNMGKATQCVQGCGHCPAGRPSSEEAGLALTSEQTDGIHATASHLLANENGMAFDILNLPINVSRKEYLSTPLILPNTPRVLGVLTGELNLEMTDQDKLNLVPNIQAAINLKIDKAQIRPILDLSYRLPIFREGTPTEKEFIAMYGLLAGLYYGVIDPEHDYFSKKTIMFGETVNDAPPETNFSQAMIAKRFHLIDCMFDGVFEGKLQEKSCRTIKGIGKLEETKTLILEVKAFTTDPLRCSYRTRIIKGGAQRGFRALETDDRCNIAFMPDQVWVGHCTNYVGDSTLRFNYKDYFQRLSEAQRAGERSLSQILYDAIQERRR